MIRNRVRAHSSPATGGLVAAVALLFSVLVACSSGDGGNAAPTTTSRGDSSATSTSTTAPRSVEDEIVSQYQAFWDARLRASEEPVNPDHPGLREYAIGAQLEKVIQETREREEEGVAFRRPEASVAASRAQVTEMDGDEATVQECVVDDTVVYRVATGEIVDDDVMTFNVEATMQRAEGKWRLALSASALFGNGCRCC